MIGTALCVVWMMGSVTPILVSKDLPSPAGAHAGQMDLVSTDDGLVMTWIEARGDHAGTLKLARFDGESWSDAQTVVDGENLFINWADFPRVMQNGSLLVVTWLEMLGDESPYAYGVRYRLSTDGGQTWAEPDWLHEDRQPTEHGFVSMAPLGEDAIAAVWLDGRAMPEGGAMQLRTRTIRGSGLGTETLVDDSTCECCGTDLLALGQGFWTVYRNKTEDQIRDIHLAEIQGDKVTPRHTVHADDWNIHGCPVNGPAITQAGDHRAVAWFSAADGNGNVKVALADKTGTFGPPLILSTDGQGRVDVAFQTEDTLVVSWIDATDEGGMVRLQALTPTGDNQLKPKHAAEDLVPTPAGRASGFPRMVAHDGAVVVAYLAEEGLVLTAVRFL